MKATDVIYKVELYGASSDYYADYPIVEKEINFTNKELAIKSFNSMLLEGNSILRSSDDYFPCDEYNVNIIPNIDFLTEEEITEENVLKHYKYKYFDYLFYVKLTTHTIGKILNIRSNEYAPSIVKKNYYQTEEYLNN